jgi:hypothetical protein
MGSLRFSARAARRRFIAARCTVPNLAAADGDGAVEFRLSRGKTGICVERRQLRVGKGVATQAMRFSDEPSFLRWCEADTLQFHYPLVCSSLKRRGCALLACGHEGPSAA